MRGVADRVVRQVRETGKPYCIEAITYRFSGHGAADILQPYRSKEEVEQHKHRDPILILRNRLGEICGLADDDVKKMEDVGGRAGGEGGEVRRGEPGARARASSYRRRDAERMS